MKENNRKYQQCGRCILDTDDDAGISFDEKGMCNHCHDFDIYKKALIFNGLEGERGLNEIVAKITKAGRNKPYDCVMGISGGIDSTYLALQAKKLRLRPLIVHVDNGWNSELAVKNIENIVNKLGFSLYTYVIEWKEFKDLQLSYLKASVVDIEALTDHAILGALYRIAFKKGIRYILLGTNVATESILPSSWTFRKADAINIRAIHKEFGQIALKTFPFIDPWTKKFYDYILRIKIISPLDYMRYIKSEVKKIIIDELGWRDYGGKHYESIFTRFYQGYILPNKFKIDKRKAHVSNLICSGQITREEALCEIKHPAYDPEQLKIDKEFVLKKLGLSQQEFEALMKLPIRKHTDFAFEGPFYKRYPVLKLFKPLLDIFKTI